MLIFHALEYKLHAEASLLYGIVIHTGEIYSKKINNMPALGHKLIWKEMEWGKIG